VGRRVCEKRISLGYNQSQLAKTLGLTFQQVQKYEKGTNRISASKLWEIARFFEVDVGYFFEGLADTATSRSGSDPLPNVTRQSVEIGRLTPTLPPRQQGLILNLVRELCGAES
jgi:transcriptional regulator with XRE-family HTH domain